jgi:uncharacterized protein (TIGR03067 family)
MSAHALWLLVVGASLSAYAPAPLPKPDPSKADLKKLQGSWVVKHHEMAGKPRPLAKEQTRGVFAGDKLTFYRGTTKTTDYTIAVDAKAKPGTLDLKRTGATLTFSCIYAFKGDTLEICYGPSNPKGGPAERPKAFVTAGTPNGLMILERQKP